MGFLLEFGGVWVFLLVLFTAILAIWKLLVWLATPAKKPPTFHDIVAHLRSHSYLHEALNAEVGMVEYPMTAEAIIVLYKGESYLFFKRKGYCWSWWCEYLYKNKKGRFVSRRIYMGIPHLIDDPWSVKIAILRVLEIAQTPGSQEYTKYPADAYLHPTGNFFYGLPTCEVE
jgi:hypothetical protein